jgi:hypothetical protein
MGVQDRERGQNEISNPGGKSRVRIMDMSAVDAKHQAFQDTLAESPSTLNYMCLEKIQWLVK